MNAKDRARQRLTGQAQTSSSPVIAQDEDTDATQDRKAAARARLQNNTPVNSAVHRLQADDAVSSLKMLQVVMKYLKQLKVSRQNPSPKANSSHITGNTLPNFLMKKAR